MENRIINCVQCEKEFEFTYREQEKYLRLGFDLPKRCPQCRRNKAKTLGMTKIGKFKHKKKHYQMKYDMNTI